MLALMQQLRHSERDFTTDDPLLQCGGPHMASITRNFTLIRPLDIIWSHKDRSVEEDAD
jgi:hypothetical protein